MSDDEERAKSEWGARVEHTRALYRKAMHGRQEAAIAKPQPLPMSEIHATGDTHNRRVSGAAMLSEFSTAVELDHQTDLRISEGIASISRLRATVATQNTKSFVPRLRFNR
jgi:hypothetical protein